ncbi:unnamed protein product, partial [Symbiodinium sp. KB8]
VHAGSDEQLRPPRRGIGPSPGVGWGQGVGPAFILQDPMHSRLAGSRGDDVEGELEQELARALCAATATMLL